MIIKCKTCAKAFIPPKNVLNCSKCIIFETAEKPSEGASSKEESESEEDDKETEETESDEQNYGE